MSGWQRSDLVGPDFYVSVNVCGATARLDTLREFLVEKIERFEVPPSSVVVELSEETSNINNETLTALHRTGVRIAVDDIGLLNSNLERLASTEPHIAKFDRVWLTESCIGAEQESECKIAVRRKVVLKNMVSICSQLGMDCVIEGVEHDYQLSLSREIGINRFQGYLFDRALSAEEFGCKLQNTLPSLWWNQHTRYSKAG